MGLSHLEKIQTPGHGYRALHKTSSLCSSLFCHHGPLCGVVSPSIAASGPLLALFPPFFCPVSLCDIEVGLIGENLNILVHFPSPCLEACPRILGKEKIRVDPLAWEVGNPNGLAQALAGVLVANGRGAWERETVSPTAGGLFL